MRRSGIHRAGGFFLTEVLISVAVSAAVLGSVFAFLSTGAASVSTTTALATLELQTSRTLHRIARELTYAGAGTVTGLALAPLGSSGVTYQKIDDVVAGAPVWSLPRRIEFRQDPRDPDDGIDNNGNGLVDEGEVVLRIDPGQPGEVVHVLASGVAALLQGETGNLADDNGNALADEPGLSFVLENNAITVRLTLQRIGPTGQVFTRTFQTSVTPRS